MGSPFQKNSVAYIGPTDQPVAIVQSDSTPVALRAIRYGGEAAADIAVIGLEDETNSGAGTAVTIKRVQPGEVLDMAVKRVMSTNTTAADVDMTGYK